MKRVEMSSVDEALDWTGTVASLDKFEVVSALIDKNPECLDFHVIKSFPPNMTYTIRHRYVDPFTFTMTSTNQLSLCL